MWFFIAFTFAAILVRGYVLIAYLRRWRFEKFKLRKTPSNIKTLVVGNIQVGGTGKTPFVMFLLNNLQLNIAVLSRGYGRKSTGFQKVTEESIATEVGDEPLEIFNSHNKQSVYVCEDRLEGISNIGKLGNYDMVLLDDGYQHLPLKAQKNVILTPYSRLFTEESFSLPVGRLRELPGLAGRSDIVVVTKCPMDLKQSEAQKLENSLLKYTNAVFFAHYSVVGPIIGHNGEKFNSKRVILVTGIAPTSLEVKGVEVVKHFKYSDHFQFSQKQVNNWLVFCEKNEIQGIIFTRKDRVRMLADVNLYKRLTDSLEVGEIFTEVEILFNQTDKLLSFIKE